MVADRSAVRKPLAFFAFILVFSCSVFFTACQSPATHTVSPENMVPTVLALAPGDTLEITFPGATNLNRVLRIGAEGAVTMPLVGQVQAAGKTAVEFEAELERMYEKELSETTDRDVIVTLSGSANVVYVTGSVARPGRVQMERPLTVLEAILEVGGFLPDANMKHVTVLRYEGDILVPYPLNLQPVFEGVPTSPFYLKPRDVVSVPRKVQWF